jgi:hypothetical protein
MPLNAKGQKIMAAMKQQYGEKKGERVFYASRNKGKIKGVDPESSPNTPGRRRRGRARPDKHKRATNMGEAAGNVAARFAAMKK